MSGELTDRFDADADVVVDGVGYRRPRTRDECRDGPRPCPWVACKNHLLVTVRDSTLVNEHLPWRGGSAKVQRLGRAPRTVSTRDAQGVFDEWLEAAVATLFVLPETCLADIEEREKPLSLDEIGYYIGGTRERIRQIEEAGKRKTRRDAELREHAKDVGRRRGHHLAELIDSGNPISED